MKHKLSITLILLGMFLLTQFIGLWVVAAYMPITESTINQETGEIELIVQERNLPFGLQTPDEEITTNFISIVFSFIFALAIILILMKYKWKLIIRTWFFIVISLDRNF